MVKAIVVALVLCLFVAMTPIQVARGQQDQEFRNCVLRGQTWDECANGRFGLNANPFEGMFSDEDRLGGGIWRPSIPERFLMPLP